MPLAEDVDLELLAIRTEGYSGADLAALVREAAMLALREDVNATKVHMRHFMKALEVVKPSITQDMIKFYEEWLQKSRQQLPGSKLVQAKPTLFT
jgi:transitional endoplasmic reticulum ATPase